MANETIVINTGPLILLTKTDSLDIIRQLPCSFICPPKVIEELQAGLSRNHMVVVPEWLTITPLKSEVSPFAEISLDPGETEVIQLALESGIPRVCIDDERGRKVAKRLGLRVTGLLGLLAWAKTLGITGPLRPLVERLVDEGAWYSRELIELVLRGVNEGNLE